MPEDFEATPSDLQEPEVQVEEPEGSPEPEPEPPSQQRHVPFERFQEVYDDLKSERASRQQLTQQIMQMQQQLMAQTQRASQPPPPPVDPEVAALIDPILKQHLAPYQQRLNEMQQREAAMWANQEAATAWEYVKSEVPDLDALAPDMQAYLSTLPQGRANKITSDPDLVIQTANLVRAMKEAGKSVGVQAAKQDLKQRTKSDVGAASPASFTSKIDWSDPNLDWAEAEAKLERMRRSGR